MSENCKHGKNGLCALCYDEAVFYRDKAEREFATLTKWQKEIMDALPCGYIPSHTPENAVGIIQAYLKELVEAKQENDELNRLFDLQHNRTRKADKMWQEATGETCLPDLGKLVEWLVRRGDNAIHLLNVERQHNAYPQHASKATKERDEARAALCRCSLNCEHLSHRKREQHNYDEPCPVEAMVRKAAGIERSEG